MRATTIQPGVRPDALLNTKRSPKEEGEEAKAIHLDTLKENDTNKDKTKTLGLIQEKSIEIENGDAIKDVWLGNFF